MTHVVRARSFVIKEQKNKIKVVIKAKKIEIKYIVCNIRVNHLSEND